MSASATPIVLVSVIIKALNEERRIAACIESALQATAGFPAEIILVDSLSEDRTVAIASAYPVRIVQFERREDRGCGAAVELGWRYARGEYVYLLDADMQLQSGFLQVAIDFLKRHPTVAGVAGKLIDTQHLNAADMQRMRHALALTQPVVVPELGGGGLYRRSAIQAVGYLAHPALQAYEEAELGCRLRAKGFTLVRLPALGVFHEGHAEGNLEMARRVWQNGRLKAAGTFLRSAFGRAWFGMAVRKVRHLLGTASLQLISILCAVFIAMQDRITVALLVWLLIWLSVVAVLALRNGSLQMALWRVLFWNLSALALLAGLLRAPNCPTKIIAAREILPKPR